MGHSIEAIITKGNLDKKILSKYDLPCFFHENFSIIGLDASHSDFWAEKLNKLNNSEGKIGLNCAITHFFATELGLSEYAVISTDYFGGVGEQYAIVYNSGKVIMEETENGINHALKILGVRTKENQDEFDTISLYRYRSFEKYFIKYQ